MDIQKCYKFFQVFSHGWHFTWTFFHLTLVRVKPGSSIFALVPSASHQPLRFTKSKPRSITLMFNPQGKSGTMKSDWQCRMSPLWWGRCSRQYRKWKDTNDHIPSTGVEVFSWTFIWENKKGKPYAAALLKKGDYFFMPMKQKLVQRISSYWSLWVGH